MPELPEVETIRRQLEPILAGRAITTSASHPSEKFVEAPHAAGAGIDAVRRRGKYLILDLDDDRELIVHLGMTGQLSVQADPVHDDYVRAWWALDDGSTLVFRDVRRFGRIRVVEAGDYASIATLHELGPEPFDDEFTPAHLHRELRASSRRIKTQLLSQRPVAGLGNIYADEALFLAGIDPRARRVGRQRCDALALTIKSVLKAGIDNGGTTLRDYVNAEGEEGQNQHELVAYGRGGEPCVTCAEPLQTVVLDARTTTFCRNCQRR